MPTLRLQADPAHLDEPEARASVATAAELLRNGGTVALPTETVYGLGANALDEAAVARIFEAKERPGWDPLIVHVCDMAMLDRVATGVPEAARRLMQAFWPGPLTLLLPRSAEVPDTVTAGRPLVGVRMPRHPVALEVIRQAGVPVAAPSANRFGHTSPTTAEHVMEDLDGRIDAVLDGGPTDVGVESTVVDATAHPMVVYRPGAITLEQIRAVAGPAEVYAETAEDAHAQREALPSPGVGMRHYAPRARLILVDAHERAHDGARGSLENRLAEFGETRVGLMLAEGGPLGGAEDVPPGVVAYRWGNWADAEELAHRLFAGLRWLDAQGCEVIVCPVPPGDGIGAAIGDRLRKAGRK